MICNLREENKDSRTYSAMFLTTNNGGLFTCSWKPRFVHADITEMPASGVKQKVRVLK